MEIVNKYYVINNGTNLGVASKAVIVQEKIKEELLKDGTLLQHKYKEEEDFIKEDFDYDNATEITFEQYNMFASLSDVEVFLEKYNEFVNKEVKK